MTSKDETTAPKKRAGRKRQPPLPPGPPLQFVVANHPKEFRTEDTMRNIRSHVMYKHRGEQRGLSPSNRSTSREGGRSSRAMTRTPSPMAMHSEDVLEDGNLLAPPGRTGSTTWEEDLYRLMTQSPSIDPMRSLVARIIAICTTGSARSAPPTFEQGSEFPFLNNLSLETDSLEDLKHSYISTSELAQDSAWMGIICNNPMSFVSHVSASCVYQDVAEGFLENTALTVYAKTTALRMIKNSLQGLSTQTDDSTILSILYLLISEIGGFDEGVFNVHQEGLVHIVQERGGLQNLGLQSYIAIVLTIVTLCFTVIRSQLEPLMLHGFAPGGRLSAPSNLLIPFSPLYAPSGDLSSLFGFCSDNTYEILCDMEELKRIFFLRWSYVNDVFPPQSPSELASYDADMQRIYSRLLHRPSAEDEIIVDWVYESCRLAALIYCRSIVQGVPLSDAASVMSGAGLSYSTVVAALHNALNNTDRSEHWGPLRGVFLWICLVGGAASWPAKLNPTFSDTDDGWKAAAWTRKCFALYTVKTALGCGFDHASAVIESQRTMLQIQHLINLKMGISSQ